MTKVTSRTATGIDGFDGLVEGGFPRNSSVLISGAPGTGKTTFALQFIYNGIKKFKENAVYVTMEEPIENLKATAKRFGMDFEEMDKKGSIIFLRHHSRDKDLLSRIREAVEINKAKRLVIDSLASLMTYAPFNSSIKSGENIMEYGKDIIVMPAVIGENMSRVFIHNLIDDLRTLGCTTLLTTELGQDGRWLSRDSVSEFVCDGVIVMSTLTLTGEIGRSLTIRKMRMTKHTLDVHGLAINNNGIKILPAERGVKI